MLWNRPPAFEELVALLREFPDVLLACPSDDAEVLDFGELLSIVLGNLTEEGGEDFLAVEEKGFFLKTVSEDVFEDGEELAIEFIVVELVDGAALGALPALLPLFGDDCLREHLHVGWWRANEM